MSNTITPKGTSGLTNLPATSATQGPVSGPTVSQDGVAWGAEVAADTDSSFNFDDYAQSTAAAMESQGYTSSATETYINAMYAGYLASGGQGTKQATGTYGQSTVANAGIYGNLNTATFNLPGTGSEPAVSSPGGTLSLSASTATMLGTSLANNAGVNYPQWRANMEADLQDAGYTDDQVRGFMANVDNAFYNGNANNVVNQGVTFGQSLSQFSSSGPFEAYLTTTLIPSLQKQGLTNNQINQYVEGVRAGLMSEGNSTTLLAGEQQGQEMASLEAATSSFNFDSYAQSVASQLASPSSGLDAAQQQAFIDAMYAGYLRAGGTGTVEATTVSQVSPSQAAAAGSSGSVSGSSPAGGGATTVLPKASPAWASTIYNAVAASAPNATLATDATNVQSAEAALSSAAYLAQQNPSSPQYQQNLQTQWQNARAAESKFWSDLQATNSPYAASAAVFTQQYNNPFYTLEGNMPSSYTPGAMPSAASSAAYTSLNALASSGTLGQGVSLPSNLADIINNPHAISSMSEKDFSSMAEGLIALYQTNPSVYYSAVQSIHDPQLAAALNYTVNDMVTNSADSLVQNGQPISKENATLGSIWQAVQSNPGGYSAWKPATAHTGASTALGAIPTSTSNAQQIADFLGKTGFSPSSPGEFSDACQMMAKLFKNDPQSYYQVLSGVADANLRNALNASVQIEFIKNPGNVSHPDRAAGDYINILNQYWGKTGPGASAATWTQLHVSMSSTVNGAGW